MKDFLDSHPADKEIKEEDIKNFFQELGSKRARKLEEGEEEEEDEEPVF